MVGIYLRANISENMWKNNHRIALGGSLAEYFYIALHVVFQNEIMFWSKYIYIYIPQEKQFSIVKSLSFKVRFLTLPIPG